MFIANSNHGSSTGAIDSSVDALTLLAINLSVVSLRANKYDIVLGYTSIVGAAMGALLVTSTERSTTAIVLAMGLLLANGVPRQILTSVMTEVEERVAIAL